MEFVASMCVCACVCVCVCVCVCSSDCKMLKTYLRGSDQRSCVANIYLGVSAKFLHSHIRKCHISPPKTKTPARNILERKRYHIMCSAKDI